ncbi:MAG: M20/M25/M40 family metallo-hydrolase, partial [Longimicrobiales bacterium]
MPRIGTVLLASTMFLACSAPPELGSVPDVPARTFTFETEEAFDASSVPAYAGDHQAIYDHIDEHLGGHIRELQRWLRQPSISAQNVGVQAMAEMLRDDMTAMGFQEAELVPTSGHPGVWGYCDAGAERTLMVYLMYDVQPVIPEDWDSPPFEANLVDRDLGTVLMARGATNQKGPERA